MKIIDTNVSFQTKHRKAGRDMPIASENIIQNKRIKVKIPYKKNFEFYFRILRHTRAAKCGINTVNFQTLHTVNKLARVGKHQDTPAP